jgi:outer membrane protein insertion porin family
MTDIKKLTSGALLALAVVTVPAGSAMIGVTAVTAAEEKLISSVLFEGNQGISDKDLALLVNVSGRGSFTDATLAADVESVRQAYIAKGYVNVKVATRLETGEAGRTRIVFVIEEGTRTGIAAINITGNHAIPTGTLKSILRSHETGLLSWLTKDDSFSDDQLQIDKLLIENYYADHGFPDAQVTSAVGEYDTKRNAYFVNFTVAEGERYRFGAVTVESSIAGLSTSALESIVRTHKGDIYSQGDLKRSQEDMAAEATSQGFAFADVRPRVERDATSGVFNVTYLVDEGARLYVERINITGNTKTRDAVIRRELDFSEGDAFNRSMVQRGKAHVEALSYISSVNVSMEPGSAPDKVVLNVAIEEGQSGDYGATFGYDTEAGVIGDLSFTESNFLGRGQYLKASLGVNNTGGRTVDFSFTEPRFMGLDLSAGVDVYHRIQDETKENLYGTTATGGQIRFGARLTRDVTASVFTGVESKVINDRSAPTSSRYTDGEEFNKAWVGYSLNYNTLDNGRHPTEGMIASFTQQYIGWDYNLLKTEAKARYFVPLMSEYNIIASVKGQAGYLNSFSGPVGPLEAYRNPSGIVRGFQPGSFGPKKGSESLGFTGYIAGSAEIEMPLPMIPETWGLRAAVWADAAVISGNGDFDTSIGSPDANSVDNDVKSSAGLSLIWDSPFGPLRADYSFVQSKASTDKEQRFTLTLQRVL